MAQKQNTTENNLYNVSFGIKGSMAVYSKNRDEAGEYVVEFLKFEYFSELLDDENISDSLIEIYDVKGI